MTNRRLAILGTRGIPARYGGFETFAEELAVRLVEMGVEVTVYCEAGGAEQPAIYKGVKLIYLPSTSLGPFTTILFDLRCLWHARKGYDTVYMLGYGSSIFCFIPRLWGSEVWINMDGIEWRRSKWSWPARVYLRIMEGIAMWTPNRIISDARGIKDFLCKRHWHIPPCDVIPYGAVVTKAVPNPVILDEWGLASGIYYLVVCRLEPENNVLEIIEGYLSSTSGYPLIVVGNHDIGTEYVRELLKLKSDRVRFIGAVYDSEKLAALRYHATAYFHGHTVGGTNPSLLEALGCGNVIIAHDNVFNREVAGDTAVYFSSSGDIPSLIKSVESLSIEERDKIALTVKMRVMERYSWETVAEDYLKLLKIVR